MPLMHLFHLIPLGCIWFNFVYFDALVCTWLRLVALGYVGAMLSILVTWYLWYLFWCHVIYIGVVKFLVAPFFLLVNLYSYCCCLLHLVALGCAWLHFLNNVFTRSSFQKYIFFVTI